MPNHITNIVQFVAPEEDYEIVERDILPAIKGDHGGDKTHLIDFHKIVPMPEDIVRGDINMQQIEDSKGRNWYDWCPKNWGTKWNAYDISFDGYDTLRFDTAWSNPEPVMQALSKMFPSVVIWVMYADEDIGNNLGAYKMRNGKKFDEWTPKDEEADYFARAIKFAPQDKDEI